MLKKLMIISALLFVGINISAKDRTWAEKRVIALKTIKPTITSTRADDIQLSELYSTSTLSVVGNDELGFVVVSNNDKWQPVLGYSTSSFKESETPSGLLWWMQAITEAMETSSNSFSSADILASTRGFASAVEPLITTTWDQGNPYNYQCPSMATKGNYPTGCVATALSQLMNYHKYPSHGQGSFSYVYRPSDGTAYQLSANFEDTYYDWDNMLDNYSKGYNDAQRDAVATLMAQVGISVQMDYNPSGSGAYIVEATDALRNFFRYNENVCMYDRSFYSAELWMQLLYTELNNKRPVYYKGQDPDNGGHAFIIDGYDADGLVHVNWGWNGKNNGYYDIALLNPGSNKFTDYQGMIANISPTDSSNGYESQLGADGFSINVYGTSKKRLSMSAMVYAAGANVFNGKVAAILQSEDTLIVAKVQEDVELKPADQGFKQGVNISLKSIDITDIPDGTYRVFMGCRCEKDTKWQTVRVYKSNVNSGILVKSGSDFNYTEYPDDMWTTCVTAVKIDNDHRLSTVFDLQGRSHGTDPSALPRGIYIINGKKVVK